MHRSLPGYILPKSGTIQTHALMIGSYFLGFIALVSRFRNLFPNQCLTS